MNEKQKRNVGIASVVVGLYAWLAEKLGWVSARVSDGLTLVSLVLGTISVA